MLSLFRFKYRFNENMILKLPPFFNITSTSQIILWHRVVRISEVRRMYRLVYESSYHCNNNNTLCNSSPEFKQSIRARISSTGFIILCFIVLYAQINSVTYLTRRTIGNYAYGIHYYESSELIRTKTYHFSKLIQILFFLTL